ncbi:MAG: TatD family hydrolase [Firmicutes bacterium]|nr:TatD family hydrolase [Bacillota bacterium]
MKLFDSHAHITDSKFDASTEVGGFDKDNISLCLTVGYDLVSSKKVSEFASRFDKVYGAVGVHPHSASELTESMCAELIGLAKDNPKIVAIGEIGLDYYRNLSPVTAQQKTMLRQMDIAEQVGLPVIFHIRDAYSDMQKLIGQNLGKLKNGALLHCFSGDANEVKHYLSIKSTDFYFSFSGVVTYKNSNCAEAIKVVPYDRLLIETDCPYLAPEPYRGKLNRPAYVYFVAAKIAEILGKSTEDVAEQTHTNACRLFGISC